MCAMWQLRCIYEPREFLEFRWNYIHGAMMSKAEQAPSALWGGWTWTRLQLVSAFIEQAWIQITYSFDAQNIRLLGIPNAWSRWPNSFSLCRLAVLVGRCPILSESASFHEPELVAPKRDMAGGRRVRLVPTLDQLAPPVPSSKAILASYVEPSSLLFTNRTERHSQRLKCTQKPRATFRRSATPFFFVCMKDGTLKFSRTGQRWDKWPASCQIASSGPGCHCTWSAWRPAFLSNKLLTLLKRWHFSSLFIKLPKEHLSWGANKRGIGEEWFSPCLSEPWNWPPRPG